MTDSGRQRNLDYYETLTEGQSDYWRYMAAPRHRSARIIEVLRPVAPASLLDAGCGDGALLRDIRAAFPRMELAGIDLSPAQIERNRERDPSISWFAGDLAAPPPIDRLFEAVVASEVIEHMDEPRALLRTARRLLAPSGLLVLSTQSGTVRETEKRVGHVRHFSAEELESLLGEERLQPLRVWNEGFPFHDLSKWWANRDAEKSMRQFGAGRYGRRERAICAMLRFAFRFNSRKRGAQLFAVARRIG